jgi:hypothetical protein
MINDVIISELEEIINSGMESVILPYIKGNSIRIKHFIIRKNSHGYLVYDCKTNSQVAKTHFKTTAVAIAKNLVENKDIVKAALKLDQELLKNYNDAVFYKHIIKNSKDRLVIGSRKTRLDIAITQSSIIKDRLDNFIY